MYKGWPRSLDLYVFSLLQGNSLGSMFVRNVYHSRVYGCFINQVGIVLAIFLSVMCLSVGCSQAIDDLPIVPKPVEVHRQYGSFLLNDKVTIGVDQNVTNLVDVAQLLEEKLKANVGMNLTIKGSSASSCAKNTICLQLTPKCEKLGPEGYELNITPESIVIRGATRIGVIWGVQSLLQIVTFQSLPEKNGPLDVGRPGRRYPEPLFRRSSGPR